MSGEGFGNGGLWAGIGTALLALVAAIAGWPKTRAAARKLNADADDTIAARFTREIKRLDDEIKDLRDEVIAVKTDADVEKRALERENKQLKRLLRTIAAELHKVDPQNVKLASVARVLNRVFGIDASVPDDMLSTLREAQ